MRKSTKFTLPMLLSTPLALTRCLGPLIPFQSPSWALINPVCLISRLPRMLVDIAYRYYYSFSPSDSDLFDLLRAFSTPSGLLPPTSGLLPPPPPSLLRSILELLLIIFVKIKITSENVGNADRHYLSPHIVLRCLIVGLWVLLRAGIP